MSMRERWAASFDPKQKELWSLERHGEVFMYLTKDRISADESDPFRHPEPMYHVWSHDRHVYCAPDMRGAYRKYESETRAG